MKTIYCIEEQLDKDWQRLRDKEWWDSLEFPWTCRFFHSRVLAVEFDDEEKFKEYLQSIIDDGCFAYRIFTREVSDDYKINSNDDIIEEKKEECSGLSLKYKIISWIVIIVATITIILVLINPKNANRFRYPYQYQNDTVQVQK